MTALAKAASAQSSAWDRFCADRTPKAFASLKAAFGATADAWVQVDFVRLGPATTEMRTERFNYWIDRGNAAGKSLNAMVAAPDESGLTPEAIKGSSAAAQGLPVLERLLFDEGATDKLVVATPDGARRCAVGRAVAANLAAMAGDIARGWSGPDGVAASVKADKPFGVFFKDRREAASVLLTDLVIGLESLKENEIAMMFHDEANATAPRFAEQWRSGRSLRNLQLKYAAVKGALLPYLAKADGSTKSKLDAGFADADAKLSALAKVLDAAPRHAPERIAALQAAMLALGTLMETVLPATPTVSGIPLGFNSLDGD